MRTRFTGEDLRNLIDQIFNGNLWQSKVPNSGVLYQNENSEEIVFIDEDGTETKGDLAEYLNIHFYNWKQRLVDKGSNDFPNSPYYIVDDWVSSLNMSMNEAYALVEKTDEEVTASQDIDAATLYGKVTFLIQSNKVSNLDYYVTQIRNKYLGLPQDIQNSYGDKIKAFILIGSLIYDAEPFMTQVGECMQVSLNFSMSYLGDAMAYSDTKIEISLDGDDLYDEHGNIVDAGGNLTTTKYLQMPITKATLQKMFAVSPVTTQERPDLTGFVSTALSTGTTFTFYDFNKQLTNQFNELFYSLGAYRVDGVLTSVRNVNIPIYIRMTIKGHSYVYKDVIERLDKSMTDNEFNISSITTRGYGKIE